MSIFYPGSTPVHTFSVPFSAEFCRNAYVSYRQGNKTLLTKTTNVFTDAGEYKATFTVLFSQAESLRFEDNKDITAQINLITADSKRHTSDPCLIHAGVQYERQVIS